MLDVYGVHEKGESKVGKGRGEVGGEGEIERERAIKRKTESSREISRSCVCSCMRACVCARAYTHTCASVCVFMCVRAVRARTPIDTCVGTGDHLGSQESPDCKRALTILTSSQGACALVQKLEGLSFAILQGFTPEYRGIRIVS